MTITFSVDFSKATPEAHNYAVEKLREKFGEKGKCNLLDYLVFYAEKLKQLENK